MSRRSRILTIIGLSVAGLVLVLVVGVLITVQTQWFRDFVRGKIIATTEESTGGRVELRSFDFDWTTLTATMKNFVIHGTEPAGVPPLFSADQVQVQLKLLAGFKKAVDLRSLTVDRPFVNVIVNADGSTNIPAPKIKKKPSDKSGLETVVDLAIGKFELRNGTMLLSDRKLPLNARGNNVSAQLFYNALAAPHYEGRMSIAPLHMTYQNNQPLDLNVTIPVTLEKDRIAVADGKIGSGQSELILNGSVTDMKSPKIQARVNGHLSLQEAKNFANLPVSDQAGTKLPGTIDTDLSVTMDNDTIQVQSARMTLGESNLEASGTLRDPKGQGAAQFKSTLALGQLGRLFKIPQQPEGVVNVNGNARLKGSDYFIDGNIHAQNVSVRQGTQQIENISLASAFAIDPRTIDLRGLDLRGFGGQFTGNASVANMARFRLDGRVNHMDLQTASRAFGKPLPYDGVVSGPVHAEGNLKAPGISGINANVQLAIAPGRRGIPVSGRINAVFSGATDSLQVNNSYLQLPNTRLDLSGALGRELQVRLSSRNLEDLVAASGSKIPITLEGPASFNGTVTGSLSDPRVAGHLALAGFSIEGRHFDRLSADVAASRTNAALHNALLTRGPMQTTADATIALRAWKPAPSSPLQVTAGVRNGDLADILALAGQSNVPGTGALSASANIGGTYGNPTGNVTVDVLKGSLYQEPFDRLNARVNFSDQLISIPGATLTSGPARIDLNGTFQHPRDSFTRGHLDLHVASNQVQLAQFQNVVKQRPGLAGVLQLRADATGDLTEQRGETKFLLSSVNADFNVRGLQAEGKNYGDLNGTARTNAGVVSYDVNSDFASSTIRVNGQTRLAPEYPTTANASISNLPVEQVLAVAGRRDVPVTGTLSATASVSGTMTNPSGSADFTLAKAVVYDEPLDRLHARVTYSQRLIDLRLFEVTAGPNRIAMNAQYSHAPNDFENGQLRFNVANSTVQLGQLKTVQRLQRGMAGAVQLAAEGAAAIRRSRTGSPEVLLSSLNANVDAVGLRMNGKNAGDLRFKAQTQGDTLNFNLESDIANSKIHGGGRATLRGDYPVTAQLQFANVTYSGLRPLLPDADGSQPAWDALVEGEATVNGPAMRPDDLRAALNLSRVQVSAASRPGATSQPVAIHNDGPVVFALDRKVVRIQSAHLVGPQTDIRLTGNAPLAGQGDMDVSVKANTDLGVLQQMSQSIYSSGAIVVSAVVRGPITQPLVNGRLELKDASINYIDFPNGISHANGVILLNGTTATIDNLVAQSGGGKVTLAGFVSFPNRTPRYNLRATAARVRVRYPPGMSIVASANVTLSGTTEHSLASGDVTLSSFGFSPRSDFGSILSRGSTPPEVPSAPAGPLAGMRLDIRIRTAAAATFVTSLAQDLQADANLRLRGTATSPGMTGRINITQGKLVFFGSEYNVQNGSIAFYDPYHIRPVLDVSLNTVAKGVNVTLNVNGPVDNMKLSYSSDPPLQFQEVVALLATGRTPTSDPNLAAREPAAPPSSFQQMGESALLSSAVANPVSNRLQRVFGINRLKIDPTFTSGSELPQARVTLQQQITSKITFTYITNLTQTNSQIVRIEWALDQNWSATATREENGLFGVDFFWKKELR